MKPGLLFDLFRGHRAVRAGAAAVGLALGVLPVRAAVRCDVFVGHDGVVSEGCWGPITFEVQNDGPAFNGTFVITSSSMRDDQSRSITLELPTGTIKRFTVPAFTSGRYAMNWNVALFDELGRKPFEQGGLRPRVVLANDTPVLGALTRTLAGMPSLPKGPPGRPELSPTSARLQAALFPDNPIALEGLDAIYLNTELAGVLRPPQVNALLGWVRGGGHLVIGFEQPGDLAAAPWLRAILPFEPLDLQTITMNGQFRDWVNLTQGRVRPEGGAIPATRFPPRQQPGLTPLPSDATFDTGSLLTVTGTSRGEVMLRVGEQPVVVDGRAGRGHVTVLCFSPEREPFKSWRNAAEFWGALLGIEPTLPNRPENSYYTTLATDGVWGVLVETKQVHKLPVGWLLLILLGYLAVIGPLDQMILKRLNRQMLTWVTFPLYVLAFSLLIYFIGYKLRAGESEWNEISVVDVLPAGERAELRGRTYASLYSPANQRYDLASNLRFATIRNEYQGSSFNNPSETESLTTQHEADSFKARAMVPVWSSRLFVTDWWQPAEVPLQGSIARSGTTLTLTLQNRLSQPLRGVRVAYSDRLWQVGDVAAGQTTNFTLQVESARPLAETVGQMAGPFQVAINQRKAAFGSNLERLPNTTEAAVGASLIGPASSRNPPQLRFTDPGKTDLLEIANHGDAVVFGWVDNYSLVTSMNQFKPLRTRRDTLLRLAIPMSQ